jgi:hypothetical protein
MIQFENITLGSDMEFFLRDNITGRMVSAEGYIPGTKDNPYPVPGLPAGYCMQLDNIVAEGNIPPVHVIEGLGIPKVFANNCITIRNAIAAHVAPHGLSVDHKVSCAKFTEHEVSTKQAQTIGCEPSCDAWTGEIRRPSATVLGTVRTTGFHLHIGYKDPSIEANFVLGRMLDFCLGSVIGPMYPDKERKDLGYGRPGDIRHKPYGMEYRVLPGPAYQSLTAIASKALKAIGMLNIYFRRHPDANPLDFLLKHRELICFAVRTGSPIHVRAAIVRAFGGEDGDEQGLDEHELGVLAIQRTWQNVVWQPGVGAVYRAIGHNINLDAEGVQID